MNLSTLNIDKANRIIGLLSIVFGLLYIPYSINKYLNFPYYHLNPNIFYFYPPHQLTFYPIVWFYGVVTILSGLLILKRHRLCLHLYNLLFIGLLVLNGKRIIGFQFEYDWLRNIGNIFFVIIAISGLYYFSRPEVRQVFIDSKKIIKTYLIYIFLTLMIFVLPHFV